MRIERNLRLIDIFTIGMNMLFLIPVIIPYYRDQIGLGFKEFLIGEAFFAATVVALEVPTGWISDIWRRKHTLALGILLEITGYACLMFAHSLFMAIVAQSLIGVGISLISGTNVAMLYDSLLSRNREGEFRRREGRRQAVGFYTIAIAGIVGGLTYAVHPQLPLAITLVALMMSLTAACLMDEPERHKRAVHKNPFADMFVTMKYALHGHAIVAFIIFLAAILFCTTKIIMWSQQPYYMAMNIPEAWFGFLMAGGFLIGGVASHSAHLLDGHLGPYRALAFIWVFAVMICLSAGFAQGWVGVGLLMMGGTCVYAMASPRVSEIINSAVDSSRRATILSTQQLMISLLFIPLSMVMGYVSDRWDIHAVLLCLAGWLSATGAALSLFRLRQKK